MTLAHLQSNRTHPEPTVQALQARLAMRIAAVLTDGTAHLPHDVTERLRFAREMAMQRARQVSFANAAATTSSVAVVGNGASGMSGAALGLSGGGRRSNPWWLRLASVLPLVALVGGLVAIQRVHVSSQISAAAEVDTALLADDLPPLAYTDPGFVEFLKTAAK